MISMLPNRVLNSNLHALRARQTRVCHAGKASKYKSKPCRNKGLEILEGKTKHKLLFHLLRNQMPRVTPELDIKYISECEALPFSWNIMEESRNNMNEFLNNIYSEECLPYLTDFFPRGFVIWEAQAIHNPAATRARSISKCRSHANLRVTWEICSWGAKRTSRCLCLFCSPVEISGFHTWTFNLGASEMETAHLPGSDAPSRSVNEPWKMKGSMIKGQKSKDHYDYARNNLVSLGDFDSSILYYTMLYILYYHHYDCCLYDCYHYHVMTMSWPS